MPEIGELRRASELPDVPDSYGRRMMIWAACEGCGNARWVESRNGKTYRRWCFPCGRREGKRRGSYGGEKHPRWRGGRHVTSLGYVQVVVSLDDPFFCMADSRGRAYEHRLVMARSRGRSLVSTEEVHHKNGDKQDNRLSNLELTTKAKHIAAHHREVADLRVRVQELERELARAKAP